MIRQALVFLGMMLVFAAAFHGAAIVAAPSVVMGVAMDRVGQRGVAVNQWHWRDRVTPAMRDIVQPSPDLAYGACAYDLQQGPVRIRVMPGAGYVGLSLYADNTDNFFTVNDRVMQAQPYEIALVARGSSPPQGAVNVVESPTRRGLALERRLAPTPEAFAAADAARRGGVCEPWVKTR